MSKKLWMLFVLALAFIAVAATSNLAAQTVLTGEWNAKLVDDNSKINLNFERGRDTGHHQSIGQTFELAELGLAREQVQAGGPVRFTLAREAGTIDCEGNFQNGKGSGTFRFTSDPSFVSAMKSRGFDFEKDSDRNNEDQPENRVFSAAVLNVTTALADDLLSAGFGKLGVSDLFKARIFKIDSAFISEMKATGFPNLTMQDLVKARIFKIDAQFVSQVAQMGFEKEGFEGLIKMRIFKVTPEFVTEVRNEGLTNLSVQDAVKLRIFNIDAEFIRKAKAEGVPLKVESLVRRRIGADTASRRVII